MLRLATFLVIAFASSGVPRDYSNFSHTTHVTTEKLACDSCHKFPTANWKDVRKGDAAFPDVTEFPEHQACLSCHRQQFFARERPVPRVCSNCHLKATPRDTFRYPFSARDFVSEFRVAFPHDKHADAACADCHNPRPRNHVACFTCHNQESELAPLPPNCDACHKPLK